MELPRSKGARRRRNTTTPTTAARSRPDALVSTRRRQPQVDMPVSVLLRGLRGIDTATAIRIMREVGIAPGCTLRQLNTRHRLRLLEALVGKNQSAIHVARVLHISEAALSGIGLPRYKIVVSGVRSVARMAVAIPDPSMGRRILAGAQETIHHAEVTVDVYLGTDDDEAGKRVLAAVDRLVDILGYDGPCDVIVARGSIVRRSHALVKRMLSLQSLLNRLRKVEQAFEVTYLDAKQAEVDSIEARAVSDLVQALSDIPQACVRVGSLFIVKFLDAEGPIVVVRNLSAIELRALEHNPGIQREPRQAFQMLALAVAEEQLRAAAKQVPA